MKILNLHGYGGSPQNAAYKALEACGCELVSPALDYENTPPEQLLETLRRLAADSQIDRLCGTSLGGFFAAVLAAELHLPVLLVNPCLMPFLHLPRLGYTGDVKPFFSMFGELSELENKRVSCIVGGSDEVIDTHDFTKLLCGNERFRVIPEGRHSGATLPLQDYFAEVLPSFAGRSQRMKVRICSEKEAQELLSSGTFPGNTAVISFADPGRSHPDYRRVGAEVFCIDVDDLDLEVLGEKGYSYESFFPEADALADFIRRAYDRGRDILCQCEYGQSRSAGCAAAILEYYYHDGISVFSDYRYYPNQVVFHKVMEALLGII